jgi:microcystin-dependent protein
MATFYLGQITTVASNFAIKGSALCNGQLMSIQQNAALFALIGTFYGGNGTTTFGLPDLQGRDMIHAGQGLGLSNYVIGQKAGAETVTLISNQLPAHTHAITSSFNASGLQPKASTLAPAAGSVLGHADDIGAVPRAQPAIYCPAGTTANVALGGLNVSAAATGGNQPVGILSPYLAITCLIWLIGVFPSRN